MAQICFNLWKETILKQLIAAKILKWEAIWWSFSNYSLNHFSDNLRPLRGTATALVVVIFRLMQPQKQAEIHKFYP